jgi:hypothetical protein
MSGRLDLRSDHFDVVGGGEAVTELDRLVVRPDVREPRRRLAEVRLEARWRQHHEANRHLAAGVSERVRATLGDEHVGSDGCQDPLAVEFKPVRPRRHVEALVSGVVDMNGRARSARRC